MYRRGNLTKNHENFQLHYWSIKYKLRLHKISITLFFYHTYKWQGYGEIETLREYYCIYKSEQLFWRTIWKYMSNTCKSYCFMPPLLVIDPRETLILEHKDAGTWMFITVLFIIATITRNSKLPITID